MRNIKSHRLGEFEPTPSREFMFSLGQRALEVRATVDSIARRVLRSIERGLNRITSIRVSSNLDRHVVGPRHTLYNNRLLAWLTPVAVESSPL